jgi:hypothetical protein
MRGAIVPWAIVAQAAICVAFGAFVAARAARLSLTYDEAAAYIRYIAPHAFPEFDAGPLAVFNFEVATNHFLSTVLAKLSTVVAGSGELALRAPALLGYALYLWFSARLLRLRTNGVIAVAGLLLLNLNPYVLDFFALSRGYGLSIGLMLGALYYFFRDDLSRMLLFATGAVLANFSMLNVYVALVLLSLASQVRLTVGTTSQVSPKADATGTGRLSIFPVAAVFAALVFSQDPGLSSSLYEPVTVRLDGLTAEQQQAVRIWRVDLRGRATPLSQARVPYRAIRIEMPAAVSDRIARVDVDVIIGNRAWTNDPHHPGAWTTRDAGATRQFESAPSISNPRSSTREFQAVINWAGDRRYLIAIARTTAIALAVLVACAVLLEVAGRFAVRARLVPGETWRVLSASALWVAALAGPPLYLLKRDAQLYFGGTRGLVQDTFSSLIESSFYGVTYHPNQTRIAFGVAAALAAAFVVVMLRTPRRDRGRPCLDTASTLGMIAIVSVSLVAQRWLFGTVYLIGRTALLFIPLYLVFLIFFCHALTTRGRIGRIAGTSILLAAVLLSGWHFARTANLQYTLDWRDDAATKMMMTDLERTIPAGRSGATTVLGVEWNYAPVSVYYARRHEPVDVDVAVAPYMRGVDFVYVAERHAAASARIVRRYPVAGTVLARPE